MNNLLKIFCWLLLNFLFQNKCLAQLKTCIDWCLFHPNECNELAHFQTLIAASTCPTGPLKLVFEDNFDGNSINLDNWTIYGESEPVKKAVPRDAIFEHSKQFYKKENVVIEDGKMKIIAKREHLENQPFDVWEAPNTVTHHSTFEFTSGEADTKWEFGYGVYEISCKLPKGGKGWYPAFWGYADANTLGRNDEIDVFEFYSSHNQYHDYKLIEFSATNHSNWDQEHVQCISTINQSIDFSEGFHKFTLEYFPYVIRWYVDDWLVKEVYKNYEMGNGGSFYPIDWCYAQSYPGEFIRDITFPLFPMNIKLNLAIQKGNDAPDANTPFPNSFEIDYLKIYQFTPCNGEININNQGDLDYYLSTQKNFYNVIFGTKININNCTLGTSNEFRALRLIASEEINFGSNFKTESGSFLEGSIGSCQSASLYKQKIITDSHGSSYSNQSFVKNTTQSNMTIDTLIHLHSESLKNKDSIGIYPNPLLMKDGVLNLNLFDDDISEVTIISAIGETISKLSYFDSTSIIKSSQFKGEGLYYISIKSLLTNKVFYFKLMVK